MPLLGSSWVLEHDGFCGPFATVRRLDDVARRRRRPPSSAHLRPRIVELLADGLPRTRRDIAMATGGSLSKVSERLAELAAEGIVENPEFGFWAAVR